MAEPSPRRMAAAAPDALPSGMVTFVFTDIEESTRLLRALGDERFDELLELHRALLRRAWRDHSGHVVDSQGDAFFVAFADAADALDACAAAQQALRSQSWGDGVALRVRIGVHSGIAAARSGRYVAVAVHQAARVTASALGGQIVVSEQAAALAGPVARHRLVARGRYRVRDFDRPVALFELDAVGAPADRRALRARPADHHNLAAPLTPMTDREDDMRRLQDSLARHRLVTLVGLGGVGKTRLVTQLGLASAPRWRDGFWLIECGPITDSALVGAAVAAALGITADGSASAVEEVVSVLRSWEGVIVLDGCERHHDAAAGIVVQLLAQCPKLQVIVTSSEPLRVPGEVVLRLEPLSTDAGLRSPAVELFLDRARAVQPGLRADEPGDVVVSICRRLDGLPLALEIAASRTVAMHPNEILAGLDRRLASLAVDDERLPPRQRTLRALLGWSVQLLSAAEAAALGRLSLFAAPFTVEAALAVADGTVVGERALPEIIWSLVDKSLLVAAPAAGGTRYRMLEIVRAYAGEQLDADLGRDACVARLAAFYIDRLGPARVSGRPWVAAAGAELDTLRPLIRSLARTDQATAAELACTLARHHLALQTYRAGIAEIGALALELGAPTPARVALLTALGELHIRAGEIEAAQRQADEAGALHQRVGAPPWDEVGVTKLAGEVAIAHGRAQDAIAIAEQALLRPHSERGRVRLYNLLGIALATRGQDQAAAEAFAAELALAASLDDEVLLAHAHSNSAEIALRLGDVAAAARHQLTCLSLAQAIGQTAMIGYALFAAARIGASRDGLGGRGDEDPAAWPVAARAVAQAESLLAETGATLYATDRGVTDRFAAEARERLGEARYGAETAAGRALAPDVAIDIARSLLLRSAGETPPSPA